MHFGESDNPETKQQKDGVYDQNNCRRIVNKTYTKKNVYYYLKFEMKIYIDFGSELVKGWKLNIITLWDAEKQIMDIITNILGY